MESEDQSMRGNCAGTIVEFVYSVNCESPPGYADSLTAHPLFMSTYAASSFTHAGEPSSDLVTS